MSVQSLTAEPLHSEAFSPYGQVILPSQDGQSYSEQDAQLSLEKGVPRFYIMRLHHRGRSFSRITRHQQCTQCLGSLHGKDWLIAVAPPSETAVPDIDKLRAFRIPGSCFIKLNLGTWHAGPYFDDEQVDFYNLELSDTNLVDHETCNLQDEFGVEFAII